LHSCDIVEDVAISYGYNNIPKTIPKTFAFASQQPINKLTDQLRSSMAECTFTEVLTFSLCSERDLSASLCQPLLRNEIVHIGNPKTSEFEVARTTLLPGLLKTTNKNKHMPLPLRLFEIDVVIRDISNDVGAKNERRLSCVSYGKTPDVEIVHGVLDRIMKLLGVPLDQNGLDGYKLNSITDPTYEKGRCTEIIACGTTIGKLGEVHSETVKNFGLKHPCTALEINIEPFI